jgi:hypothetical protein
MMHHSAPPAEWIFRDLGFRSEETQHLLVRSQPMLKIETLLKARHLKLAFAASHSRRVA